MKARVVLVLSLSRDFLGLTFVNMALEKEIETYNRELKSLLLHEGKFVVISVDQVLGIYSTYEDAIKIGYEKCGMKPFLVKKVQAIEQVQYFSRDLEFVCHTSA
jgi:hypothetical protein